MSILNRIGAAVGDSSTATDQALAAKIAGNNDTDAISELITGLDSGEKKIQSSCIKVIYETGYLKPELIADYWEVYLTLLDRKNNRLVWGGMIALWCSAKVKPEVLLPHVDRIFRAAKYGSRITEDSGIRVLGAIGAASPENAVQVMPFIMELLTECPAKKLPAYAEITIDAVTPELKDDYVKLFAERSPEMNEKQVKRINKTFKKTRVSI